jgi:hypothetical protein
VRPFSTRCSCRLPIGQTDGMVLLIGNVQIRRSVTFWCACGIGTHWNPKPAKAIAQICYTESMEVQHG